MTADPGVAVGLDVGGSRTRVLVLGPGGEEIARRVGPAAAVDPRRPLETVRVLERILRELETSGSLTLPVAGLCAGIAGAGRKRMREELASDVSEAGIARRVRVVTDGEVALQDAHGDGPGLLLVAGTGSIAWGRNAGGDLARAGGWGPLLGDEGSGHAIARAALSRLTRSADGREEGPELGPRLLDRLGLDRPEELVDRVARASRAEIASLAPDVVELADAGVGPAAEIVAGAVDELMTAVEAVHRRLGPWPGRPPLALTGGLVDPEGPLRARVARAAEELEVRLRPEPVDPVRGAALLASRMVSGT